MFKFNTYLKSILLGIVIALIFSSAMIVFGNLSFAEPLINIDREFITFQNSDKEKIGQIWADKSVLMMYGYNQRNVGIGAGNSVIINAGGGSVEIKQGNDTKIKISEDRIDINTDNLYINGEKYGTTH